MCLQKAFELSETISVMTKNLSSDIGCHNPGISSSEKIDLQCLNLDAAIIEAKLGHLRSMLCEHF